jgi:hypothetical protein
MRYIRPLVSGVGAPTTDDIPTWPRLRTFMVDKKLDPWAPPK